MVRFAPGEKHWHGALPSTSMTHIAIHEELEGKAVEWLEHVSDQQYQVASNAESKDAFARQGWFTVRHSESIRLVMACRTTYANGALHRLLTQRTSDISSLRELLFQLSTFAGEVQNCLCTIHHGALDASSYVMSQNHTH